MKQGANNLDAEKVVLGSIIAGGHDDDIAFLFEEDFYSEAHKNIYKLIWFTNNAGEVSLMTVSDAVMSRDRESAIGGISYLAEVAGCAGSDSSYQSALKIVKDKSNIRKISTGIQKISEQISVGDPEETLSKVEDIFNEIKLSSTVLKGDEIIHIKEKQAEALKMMQNANQLAGMATGIRHLDGIMGGAEAEELTIISGETGRGKSMLLQKIGANMALLEVPILYLSLEMSVPQQISRFYGMFSKSFDDVVETFSSLPIYFYGGKDTMSLRLLEKIIKNAVEVQKVKAVFIDHLHYFTHSADNATGEIGIIVRTLKELARKYNVHIFAISVLRKLEKAGTMPTINHLKDSVMLGYDADHVIMVSREVDDLNIPTELMYISVLKNRPRGKIGQFTVKVTNNFDLSESVF